jgi:RNA polymerase sigma factor (sigma-70 family)
MSHRTSLVRFAARRLRDPMLAEDLVHDVFEAVLSGRAAFAGRSSLRSWLTGILKHKIVDLVRRNAGNDSFDDGFDADGVTPLAAGSPGPDEIAEQRERLARTCRPPKSAGVWRSARRTCSCACTARAGNCSTEIQRPASAGNSFVRPSAMTSTAIAARIRPISRVMTLMPVLPSTREILSAALNASQTVSPITMP